MDEIFRDEPDRWTSWEPDPMDYRSCRWCDRAFIKDQGAGIRICSEACLAYLVVLEDWFFKTPGAKRT